MKEVKYAAYHEAGHAVARCIFNHPFISVRVWKREQLAGEIILVKPNNLKEMTPQQLEEEIVITMVGPLAEMMCEGYQFNNLAPDDDVRNLHICRAWMLYHEGKLRKIEKYYSSEDGTYIASMDAKAQTFVDEYWDEIMVTAEALLKNKILTMAEVEEIIRTVRGLS